jgi:hypothetical protein
MRREKNCHERVSISLRERVNVTDCAVDGVLRRDNHRMKIVHRVSLATTPENRRVLESAGINVGNGFVSFELNEEDESWQTLAPKLAEWQAVDVPTTTFSTKELKAAEWLQMTPQWHHGYPQPDEDGFGYLEVTCDATGRCAECGAGAKQKAPFRMKGEPKWGKRGILQLNWVFGEYFSTPEVWKNVFEPLGVAARLVLDGVGSRKLETVVQLVVTEEASVKLDGYSEASCNSCTRLKYAPVARGMFPALQRVPVGHIARTKQLFGSGASAYQAVLVSQTLFRKLEEYKTKGIGFVPLS